MPARTKPRRETWAAIILVVAGVPTGWILLHLIRGGTELPSPRWTEADLVPLPPQEQNAWYAIGPSENIPQPQLALDLLDDRNPIAVGDRKKVDHELARPEVGALIGGADQVLLRPYLAEPNNLDFESVDPLRLLYWRRWIALSINSEMGHDPEAALRLLSRLYPMWIRCANTARSTLVYRVCAGSAQRDLDLMVRANALLAEQSESEARRAAASAVRSAPKLSASNATVGEYVSSYSFLQSLMPNSRWEFLELTDLNATADLVNRSFHPSTSERLCSTFHEHWRPRFYSYNVAGKTLAFAVAGGFCVALPPVHKATRDESEKREVVLGLLEAPG